MISPARALQAADDGRLELESIVTALSTQFAVHTGSKQLVRRRRLDTFDRRLQAAGLTLEHQVVASGERLVLGRLDRSTMMVPVKDLKWPALAQALPSGPVREVIAPVIGIRALMVSRQERRRMQLLDLCNGEGKTVARVELDEPATGPAKVGNHAQLLVHRLRGYDEEAQRADRLLAGLGLRSLPDDEDCDQRDQRDQGEQHESSSALKAAGVERAAPARVLLAAALSDYLVAMRRNLPGLLDDVDTEFLHDYRVAVRRTRATLKLGRPALPEVMRQTWEPAFKWLGDLTTPVRDLDVYELDLPTMSRWLVSADPTDLDPLATHLRSRRTAAQVTLVRSLRSAKYRRLVTQWGEELAQVADQPQDGDPEQPTAGDLCDRSIARTYRRVARDGAAIGADSPAEDLHGLRKRCKELRYALEVFSPLVDQVVRKQAVADLKDLQDVLGAFQDSEVQRRALRGFAQEMMTAGTAAEAMLAMGELIGHLDVEQDRARREFDVAFARFQRPSSRQLMNRLGGGR